ncbi:methyl-accepting chemotaxis protein [Gracilibacillus dipsosauri]|uniref:Methyl-accepting chemotaxis protein n=1 Tax=Gracilibacillus dipsosauri TaxID=178340 RepID=A0A317KW96_9BACI|nr:methyl-accepting chemotaxis protein [Gracilibacillus dipsosauri]PWU67563.1 methyl-accepting chemotaxis protein [Gracilibacillus dipsosauri]
MKKLKWKSSVSTKLISLITVIVAITGIVIGIFSYNVAKAQLVESGESELRKITDGAYSILELLNQEVEEGRLSLEEAKDEARLLLNGPENNKQEYDYSQTNFVYKNNGYVLAYDEELVLQLHPTEIGSEPADDLNRSNRASLVKAGKASEPDDRIAEYSDLQEDGSYKDKTAYMRYFEPWDWTIGVAVYQDEFYEGLHQLFLVIISSVVVIIVISAIIFYLLTRKKLVSLTMVADVATSIAEGNIKKTNLKESQDEIGLLAAAFNKMSDQLTTLVTNVHQSSDQLLDAATDLSAISEQTSASSEEVGNAMEEISRGTQEQANDLEDISYRVDLLSQAVQKMQGETTKVDTITTETEELSSNGQEIVSKLQKSNSEAVHASRAIAEDIQQLNQKVTKITSVMDTIEHIAEETNLLALNASIEAARAGEHGKGFSVVADEIRKLAEQSKDATHQVQQVVSTIVAETDKTVEAVRSNVQSSEGLNNDVEETEGIFVDLQQAVKEIVAAIGSVKTEMDQITNEVEKMNENIESVSSVSEETAASVEEITSSVDEQINAIANVAKSAENLTGLNQDLSNIINRYTISK